MVVVALVVLVGVMAVVGVGVVVGRGGGRGETQTCGGRVRRRDTGRRWLFSTVPSHCGPAPRDEELSQYKVLLQAAHALMG